MARPLVYLDECVHILLAARLRRRGFAVFTAHERGMTGASDAEQLAYATQHDALILTHDIRHYRSLHFRVRIHGGIGLLPDASLALQELRAAMLLDWIASLPEHRSQLFRWHDLQQRLIQGFRLPNYREDDMRVALGHVPNVPTHTEASS